MLLFIEVNFIKIIVSVTCFPYCCFLYLNFVKTICFLSKWIRACNFVQVRIQKNIDF